MVKKFTFFLVSFVLTLLLVKAALHRIGNYDYRLTIQSSDDGPMAYSYAYKFKEIFDKDIEQKIRYASQSASAQNWVPAVLFKFFEIDPYIVTYVSTILQTVLLGLSMFLLIYSVYPENILIAFLAGVASATFPVMEWNMALYGQIMFMPYAAHLAVPFSIFAIAFVFRKQFKLAILFNLLCGMVHPSFGVYTLVFNSLQILFTEGTFQWGLQLKETIAKNRTTILRISSYFVFSSLFIILPIFMQRSAPQIAAAIQFNSWECNGHLFPLNGHYCKGLSELGMRSVPILVVFLFGFLPFVNGSRLVNQKISRFGLSLIFGLVILILVNVYATYERVWNLGLLATFRSSQVLSIILLGLSFVAASMSAKKGVLCLVPFLALSMAYLAHAPNPVYLPDYVIIVYAILGAMGLFLNKTFLQNKIVVSLLYVILSGYLISLIGVDFHRKYVEASKVILLAGLIYIWIPERIRVRFAHAMLFLCVFHFGADCLNRENQTANSDYTRNLFDAQMWAYKNTRPEEGFILVSLPTWRNFSRRPVVSFGSGTPYGTPIFAEEYGHLVNKTVAEIKEKTKEAPGPDTIANLGTKGIKMYGKAMGANYLVATNANESIAQLNLEKVYSNSQFSVYSIK